MSCHPALEEFGGLNLIRIAVVKDLTATVTKKEKLARNVGGSSNEFV